MTVMPRPRPRHHRVNADRIRYVIGAIDPTRYTAGAWLATAADGGTEMDFATWTCLLSHLPVERLLREEPSGSLIAEAARKLLGLTEGQAATLFHLHPDSTVDDLRQAITAQTGVRFDPIRV